VATTHGDDEAEFTFAELFAGVGGFRIGLEAAGGRCVFASDYCSFAKRCYVQNHGDVPLPTGDIHKIAAAQIPPHDVLAAGFPCQYIVLKCWPLRRF
jgi:DNA (cytosine-5)-methyltransferase 1